MRHSTCDIVYAGKELKQGSSRKIVAFFFAMNSGKRFWRFTLERIYSYVSTFVCCNYFFRTPYYRYRNRQNKNMTDKEAKAFYNSSAWKHKRMQILDRDHYECQDCRKRIKDTAVSGTQLIGRDRKIWRAEEVHHIQGLKEHPELGLDDDNLVSLCTQCHNLRHGRAPKRFARRKKLASEERW